VRPGPESHPDVDDHVERAHDRLVPRRPQRHAGDADGAMERLPAVVPVIGLRLADEVAESRQRPQRALAMNRLGVVVRPEREAHGPGLRSAAPRPGAARVGRRRMFLPSER
jgi:hypothetical protein